MAMDSQPRVQAPFVPGQKEAADLVDDQHSSGNRSAGDPESNATASISAADPGKLISFFGNSGHGDESEGERPAKSANSKTDELEQSGESRGTLGTGLVEAGQGVASEVSESLDAVHRTLETGLKGVLGTARGAVQRAKQGLLDILPSGLSSSSADQARQVVEDREKDTLANSEGSGEDRSHVSEGPKDNNNSAAAQQRSIRETTPTFMRAKM